MGTGEIKCAGAGEKGNEGARGTLGREKKRRETSLLLAHPQIFNFPIFSLFSPFSRQFPTEGASAEERDTTVNSFNSFNVAT